MEITQVLEVVDNSADQLAMVALGVVPACRRCGAEFSERVQDSFRAGKRVKCPACEWYGNWRDNTPLARSTMKSIQFLALFYKFSLPDSIPDLADAMNLSPTTVREWRLKINNLMLERLATDGN